MCKQWALAPRSCNATGHVPGILWLSLLRKSLEVVVGRSNNLVFAEAAILPAPERSWQSLQGGMLFKFLKNATK